LTAGWTIFTPFSLNGHPFCLIYKNESGRTEICSINEGGYIDDEWNASWSSGWTTFAPWLSQGKQFYFGIKEDGGRCEISRIQYA